MSAWEHLHGPFNFDATPLGPIGCPVIIHTKPGIRKIWDFRGRIGFNIGPALKHYRCFQVVDGVTKALLFSDTIDFLHKYLTTPTVSEGDHIVHALNFLSCSIKDSPAAIHYKQLTAISKLRDIFSNWIPSPTMTPPTTAPVPPITTTPAHPSILPVPTPRVDDPPPRVAVPPPIVTAPPPRVVPIVITDDTQEPVAHRTCSRVSSLSTASCTFPPEFIERWAASKVLHGNQWEPLALSVLDTETAQTL